MEKASLKELIIVNICWVFYNLQSTFIYFITHNLFQVATILSPEELNKSSLRTDDSKDPCQHPQTQNPGCLTNLAIWIANF